MRLHGRGGHHSGVGTRYFTVGEANELVPTLEAGFRRLFQLRGELRRAYVELEAAGHPPSWDSLRTPAEVPAEIRGVHGRFLALAMAMAEEFEAIVQTGVQVKDTEAGLCDFPTVRDDRVVLLCWKLGERAVEHWHELQGGFAGRQPLELELGPPRHLPVGHSNGI